VVARQSRKHQAVMQLWRRSYGGELELLHHYDDDEEEESYKARRRAMEGKSLIKETKSFEARKQAQMV